ncbi:MAG: bifunctional glycosyltransferase family 2/GtrA family protein [Oscillospiraceae bacterium]|nr:bifunctional glycosyltransferase family 2/GtrA family protein [Oscillospiraceae bacterium]
MKFEAITVIIPSLDPDEKLNNVVNGLLARGFEDIVIVNDGSRAENRFRFDELAKLPQCTVLTHEQNRGKGAALKTAFDYVIKNRKNCIGVITADGDDQHHPDDIANIANELQNQPEKALILGVRNFSQSDVPFRSRFGNRMTSLLFSLLCRRHITDTQTGLRAIPFEYLEKFLLLEGDRFEFETNMLLSLSPLKIPLREVTIRTIYIDDNQTSHFKPFADSMRILRLLFSFSASSLICAGADILLFWLMMKLLGGAALRDSTLIATAVARAVSSILNFFLNKTAVFNCKSKTAATLCRYYLLCGCQLLCSWAGVWGLCAAFGANSVIAKLIVDTILFFISFFIQRNWVFAAKNSQKG